MPELTPTQQHVLTELRRRGADWTADATERHWQEGREYYLDSRNQAARGLRRLFNKGNREALELADAIRAADCFSGY